MCDQSAILGAIRFGQAEVLQITSSDLTIGAIWISDLARSRVNLHAIEHLWHERSRSYDQVFAIGLRSPSEVRWLLKLTLGGTPTELDL